MKIACDFCDRIAERPTVGWIETQPLDNDVTEFGRRPIAAAFCSRLCLSRYFRPERHDP